MIITLTTLLALAMLLSACGAPAQPASTEKPVTTPEVTQPVTEPPVIEPTATTVPAVTAPTSVKIGLIVAGTLEEPWYSSHLESLKKLESSNKYNVAVQIDYTENVWGEDSLRVMREYAEAGYDIVWSTTGSDSDYIAQIQDQYPNVLFAHSGGGGTALGKNSAHVWGVVHEPAYLLGMIAGMMSEKHVFGLVGSFPSEEINAEANAYIRGAKDANPDMKFAMTFINSWWDPDKAKEAAVAQIAAGADFIYPTIYGAFEAMSEAKIKGFGNYSDQTAMAPDVILASTILKWDPQSEYLLDLWWQHATTSEPYNVPTEGFFGYMAQGGSDIVLSADNLPADVVAAVNAKKADILSGAFVVDWDQTPPKADQ